MQPAFEVNGKGRRGEGKREEGEGEKKERKGYVRVKRKKKEKRRITWRNFCTSRLKSLSPDNKTAIVCFCLSSLKSTKFELKKEKKC